MKQTHTHSILSRKGGDSRLSNTIFWSLILAIWWLFDIQNYSGLCSSYFQISYLCFALLYIVKSLWPLLFWGCIGTYSQFTVSLNSNDICLTESFISSSIKALMARTLTLYSPFKPFKTIRAKVAKTQMKTDNFKNQVAADRISASEIYFCQIKSSSQLSWRRRSDAQFAKSVFASGNLFLRRNFPNI